MRFAAPDTNETDLGEYELGTGDYRPRVIGTYLIDVPWTDAGDKRGSDCAGFAISWCYKLRRHRPGFNKGGGFDVEDDLNCNSVLGDAMGARECFELATGVPKPGDLLVYPSFYLYDASGAKLRDEAGHVRQWIGHVGIVVNNKRVTMWDSKHPRYDLLDVAQCRGPNGRKPGILLTDGSIWLHHAEVWPKPQHTVYVVRVLP